MAAVMAASNPSSPQSSPVQIPRDPAPLSAAQEQQVRELYHKRVRTKCADEIRGNPTRLFYPIIHFRNKKQSP